MGTYLTGPAGQPVPGALRAVPEHARHRACRDPAQPELAEALRAVSILAYPCTFPETGCIAALEAMAAGCAVVASDLGALAETTAGHALLVDPGEDWSSFGARYLTALDLVMASVLSPPGIARLVGTGAFRQRHGDLEQRAGEWLDFFKARIA